MQRIFNHLFQTCRGKKSEAVAHDCALEERVYCDAVTELVEEAGTSHITPAGADFLVCYSASNGINLER